MRAATVEVETTLQADVASHTAIAARGIGAAHGAAGQQAQGIGVRRHIDARELARAGGGQAQLAVTGQAGGHTAIQMHGRVDLRLHGRHDGIGIAADIVLIEGNGIGIGAVHHHEEGAALGREIVGSISAASRGEHGRHCALVRPGNADRAEAQRVAAGGIADSQRTAVTHRTQHHSVALKTHDYLTSADDGIDVGLHRLGNLAGGQCTRRQVDALQAEAQVQIKPGPHGDRGAEAQVLAAFH